MHESKICIALSCTNFRIAQIKRRLGIIEINFILRLPCTNFRPIFPFDATDDGRDICLYN